MQHAAGLAGLARVLLEDEDVTRSGCLPLQESRILVDDSRAQNAGIEGCRAVQIAHGNGYMGQSVGLHHIDTKFFVVPQTLTDLFSSKRLLCPIFVSLSARYSSRRS